MPFGFEGEIPDIPLVGLFPLAAILALLVCVLDWRACLRNPQLRVCAAFGLAGFVGCYPRPNIPHIAAAAPLALPLVACCVTWLTQKWRPGFRRFLAADVVALCAPKAIAYGLLVVLALRTEVTQTPRGGVEFIDLPDVRQLLARIQATPSTDAYFFYPYMPMIPFLSAHRQVSKYEIFVPEYTSAAQYRDACAAVVKHATWVVFDRSDLSVIRMSFPLMKDGQPMETARFERILDSAFDFASREGNFELRRRIDDLKDKVCDDMAK